MKNRRTGLRAPFLKSLSLLPEKVDAHRFPFDTLAFLRAPDFELVFDRPVTFFVGENGSGKSTLLEAIAAHCGFGRHGGSSQHRVDHESADVAPLSAALRFAWLPRVREGYFLRAETLFNIADYLDEAERIWPTGRRSLHRFSHGEAFLEVFGYDMQVKSPRIFLLDEPEAALSPMRQLVFLRLLHRWERAGLAQLIIASHSPILLAYPGARLLGFDRDGVHPVEFGEIEHVRVTRRFLADPSAAVADLLAEEDAPSDDRD